jgi:prepilin-type N-terminal cleavage/methylation domain-containing protein
MLCHTTPSPGLQVHQRILSPHPASNCSPLSALHSPLSDGRAAFTLVELLVVIAIIVILAGLGFAGMQSAMESGRKAQARNDVYQIATAVKAFQMEYGRLPGTATADGPAPADLITTLTSSNSQNPRGIVFFEPKMAKGGKGGLDGTVYKDPWGNPYTITLDYNYDNKLTTNGTHFTTVIVETRPPGANAKPINNVQ